LNRHINRLLKKKIAFVGSESSGKTYIKAMLVSWREDNNITKFAFTPTEANTCSA